MSEWINPKDRLPECADRVLFIEDHPDEIDDPHFGYYCEGWYCERESCSEVIPSERIIAWMPLPKFQKETTS